MSVVLFLLFFYATSSHSAILVRENPAPAQQISTLPDCNVATSSTSIMRTILSETGGFADAPATSYGCPGVSSIGPWAAVQYGSCEQYDFSTGQWVGGIVGWQSGGPICLFDVPCESSPVGWWDDDLDTGVGEFCTPLYNRDEEECSNVLGYIGDDSGSYQVCSDDKDDCDANGGTYGFFNNEAVCIPADYAQQVPTCDISTVVTVSSGVDSYGFGCSPPIDPPLESDPTEQPYTEKDTDGDGIPDSLDPDLDGDGLNNSVDPDVDGDGIPNEDDADSDGSRGSVSGGLSCSSRPTCQGDPVACSIVYQSWESRCVAENNGRKLDTIAGHTGSINTGVSQIVEALTGDGGTAPENDTTPIPTDTVDVSSIVSGIFSTAGASGSCPAPQVVNTRLAGTIEFSYDLLCEFASAIRFLVILSAGLAGMRITSRAF